MKNTIIRFLLFVFAVAAVAYPLYVRLSTLQWSANAQVILNNSFPLFGLTAFSLLWLHAMSGVFEPWLRQVINFDWFVRVTASLILLCILCHPVLLLMLFSLNVKAILVTYGTFYIVLGFVGWCLLMLYDLAKPSSRKGGFWAKHWHKVLLVSNIGFLITFFHSLNLGSDLQSGPLRTIWIFYGITAFAAIIYTYGLRRFLSR